MTVIINGEIETTDKLVGQDFYNKYTCSNPKQSGILQKSLTNYKLTLIFCLPPV